MGLLNGLRQLASVLEPSTRGSGKETSEKVVKGRDEESEQPIQCLGTNLGS